MKKAGVIGSGTMGSGIAQCFLDAGYQVVMSDLTLELAQRGAAGIRSQYEKKVAKGKLEAADMESRMLALTLTDDNKNLSGCDIVVEAAIENMEAKKALFGTLSTIVSPDCILSTNTSSLSITEIASGAQGKDRIIGMHFFNPAPVMALIEIIRGADTSDEAAKKTAEIAAELGKTPVDVEEAPGFVVNRLLVPMINEAIGILAEGIATAEDIDTSMKLGCNHPMGPLALGDSIGLDVCLAIMETFYKEFADDKYRPHPLLKKLVRAGRLGRKTGRGIYTY